MMKFLKVIQTVVIAISLTGTVYADAWTGLYAGVEAGAAFNRIKLKSQQLGLTEPSGAWDGSSNYSNIFSGIQLGYLYQFPSAYVTGIEANVTLNNHQQEILNCNSSVNPIVYDRYAFRNQMQTSFKGRFGRIVDWRQYSFLPYLTAGATLANVGLTYKNEGGDDYSNNTTEIGGIIGAGIEWVFRQHWSLRAEYDYLNYGNAINLKMPNIYGLQDPNGNARVNLNSNNVVVAINYWIW